MMKLSISRKHLLIIALTAILILSLQLALSSFSSFYQSIDHKALDVFYPLQTHAPALKDIAKQIVIIKIDDETIEQLNMRWPWQRKIIAEILLKLHTFNPKVIILNFSLSGESQDTEGDFVLKTAIKETGNVVLPSYYNSNTDLIMPLEIFSSSAEKTGYANKIIDADGTIRRYYPFHINESGTIDNYALEIKALSSFYNIDNKHVTKNIPLQKDNSTYINYLSKEKDFDSYSIIDIFTKNIEADRLLDKIVIVGGTSEIVHDIYPTPLGRMPGAYITANNLLTIMSKRFLINVNYPLSAFIFLLTAFFAGFITSRYGPGKASLILFPFFIMAFMISFFIFYKGFIFDWFSNIFLMTIAIIIISFYRYIIMLKQNILDLEKANIKIKESQIEIIRREQLSTIGKLTSLIIHEMNNPLSNLADFIEILKQKINEPKEVQRILDLANKEIVRAIKLGQKLKTSYTPHIDEKETININNALLDTIETIKQAIGNKGIKLELDLCKDALLLAVPIDKIKQVFLNILINAVDATEKGKNIYVSTKVFKDESKTEWVEIGFRDEGCGIPKEELDKIFDAFYTTKEHANGSGLGLFISYEIIKALQGKIKVESKAGEGTAFTIKLPVRSIYEQ